MVEITDEMVEAAANGFRQSVGLSPVSYDDIVASTPDAIDRIRSELAAVYPLIEREVLEGAAKVAKLHLAPVDEWLAHCDKMRERTRRLVDIEYRVRRGEITPDEGQSERNKVTRYSPTVYDNGALEPAVRAIAAAIRKLGE